MPDFAVGALVRARGREWVVLPESTSDFLKLRPLGGTDDEVAGIFLPLEPVESASFAPPTTQDLGDFRSCRLLRDAVRIGLRASTGPFRSFARISVEPRPYQLVPLLMAMRQDPVRLLIADDVGVGKTVEAGLIARELLDRGEVQRLCVLCPPHLAEQWQRELSSKFHIDAELVLASTARRLERKCAPGQSLFELYPHVIVSSDFIKSDRHRDDFLRACPELVIVDEAHSFAFDSNGTSGKHLRHKLLQGLSKNKDRHLILATATPHSGNEGTFRSLLGLLKEEFSSLPEDLSGPARDADRRKLADHFIQRRRADIRQYLKTDTPFPEREEREDTYKLSPAYRKLFDDVLELARERVKSASGESRQRQRVRWWAMLGLLRALGSSPAAAAAALRNSALDNDDLARLEEEAEASVYDGRDDDESVNDATPGVVEATANQDKEAGPLASLAEQADRLRGEKNDPKLKKLIASIKDLRGEGFRPIVFCRYIETAHYVADALTTALKGVTVDVVTGKLAPEDREQRVNAMAVADKRVLVATDCLSEGINLQGLFDAVVHYDLAWNPTRHEQREGRVDRFNQPSKHVRVLTLYGADNPIDGIVLEVLLKKHSAIRKSLGVSVPVPFNMNQVLDAVFEGLLLRQNRDTSPQMLLPGIAEFSGPKKEALYKEWENVRARETRSRTVFAQESLKPDEVAFELRAAQEANGANVPAFCRDSIVASGGVWVAKGEAAQVDFGGSPRGLRESLAAALGDSKSHTIHAAFALPAAEREIYLSRTHPFVEALATYVFNSSLDSVNDGRLAARSGVMLTRAVQKRTTIALLRLRFHIVSPSAPPLLAEECVIAGFRGSPDAPEWLAPAEAEALLNAEPDGNVARDLAADTLQRALDGLPKLSPWLDALARERGQVLLDAHKRVRRSAKLQVREQRVEAVLPVDVLGVYVFNPKL